MLQSDNRLRKTRDFNLLMKYGRWINGSIIDVKVLELAKIENYFPKKVDPEDFKKQLKFAITVGLKVSKSAVIRNRLKRQMSEVVRFWIKGGKVESGYYLLVLAKPKLVDRVENTIVNNYSEISQELKLLLERARVLK